MASGSAQAQSLVGQDDNSPYKLMLLINRLGRIWRIITGGIEPLLRNMSFVKLEFILVMWLILYRTHNHQEEQFM